MNYTKEEVIKLHEFSESDLANFLVCNNLIFSPLYGLLDGKPWLKTGALEWCAFRLIEEAWAKTTGPTNLSNVIAENYQTESVNAKYYSGVDFDARAYWWFIVAAGAVRQIQIALLSIIKSDGE